VLSRQRWQLRLARLDLWLRENVSRDRWQQRAAWAGFGCTTLLATPDWRRRVLWRVVGCAVVLNLMAIAEFHVVGYLPALAPLRNYAPAESTHIYSADGRLVGQLYRERRRVVPLDQIPEHVVHAFLAAEDADFYDHDGIDIEGIVRAVFKNLRPGARRQGASTITQQTIKTMVLGPERTYARKLKEALLARQLELILSKNEILHIYLNEIYFGAGAYGVDEAARTYFDKPAAELDLAEGATLAAIPRRPAQYNPSTHPEDSQRRRDQILEQMQEHGWATAEQVAEALAGPVEVAPRSPDLDAAPHYVEHVRRLLVERFGEERVYSGGLDVYTGLVVAEQEAAHRAVRLHLDGFGQKLGQRPEAALVAIDPHTREVRALVGGYDLDADGFNRAIQAQRQPGSAFKPIVYAAGLAHHEITPASQCADAPVVVHDSETGESWKPENYNVAEYSGYISYREALMRSINTCSIRVADRVGVERVIEMAHALGIRSELPPDLTLALGSGDVAPLELANAYASVAAGGLATEPVFIRSIETREGEVIEIERPEPKRVLEASVAFVLTSMLQSVVDGGTGARARALGRPLAGKTGTSNESRNVWFSGFSPDLVTTVWVGRDDNAPLAGLTGSSGALPIWMDFMGAALAGTPVRSFEPPPGVQYARVDPCTGATTDAADGVTEVFVEGTVPNAAVPSLFLVDDSTT
jgi:penicillin-binding protein 1A